MKFISTIMIFFAFSTGAESQVRSNIKRHKPKIRTGNVIIVPDQKPVIIERTLDPVIGSEKESRGKQKNKLSKKARKPANTKPLKISAQKTRKKNPNS